MLADDNGCGKMLILCAEWHFILGYCYFGYCVSQKTYGQMQFLSEHDCLETSLLAAWKCYPTFVYDRLGIFSTYPSLYFLPDLMMTQTVIK